MPFCPWVAAEKPWVLLRAGGGGVGGGSLLDVLSGAPSGAQGRTAAGFWTNVFDFGDNDLAADSREHRWLGLRLLRLPRLLLLLNRVRIGVGERSIPTVSEVG